MIVAPRVERALLVDVLQVQVDVLERRLEQHPRSVAEESSKRAVLHAKSIIVDRRKTLLTSANFTEAAQERNIEAGVVIEDEEFAKRMLRQLDYLIEDGTLVNLRLPKASGLPHV